MAQDNTDAGVRALGDATQHQDSDTPEIDNVSTTEPRDRQVSLTTGDITGSVIQVFQGDDAHAEHPASPTERRGFWGRVGESIWTIALGAAAILVASAVAAIIATSGPKHSPHTASGTESNVPALPASTRAAPVHGHVVIEYADNHGGSPVFASPSGSPVRGLPGRIPFGTRVPVVCETPNQTGTLTSVTAFYLIASGRWRRDYVVSDTMTNGGPIGNTYTPNVDPQVPRCR